jgi:hypothetical protein
MLVAGASNEFHIVLATNSPSAATANWYLDIANTISTVTKDEHGILGQQTNGLYELRGTNTPGEIVFKFGPLPADQAVDFNLWNDKGELVTNLSHQMVFASGGSAAKTNNPDVSPASRSATNSP